jgi:CubicO group peptidase (beta-lactamase class C family)
MTRPAPTPLRLLTLAACALGSIAAPATSARGQAPPPAATLPATPLGRLARQFVDVVNAGDSAGVARFVAAHLAASAMPGGDAPARTRTLVRLAAQSGGLAVERAMMAGPALRVFARARSTPDGSPPRVLGLEFEPAPGDTARLAHVGLYPMDPAAAGGPPAPWAAGALTDGALAAVVRDRVRQAAEADRFSGVVLVARGDRVLVHEAVGHADRARGVPNTPATLFQTTSVGKMFTGVAVAQLVRAGKLSFDDTLARVLPGYPNADAARRTTVRQLLTHTAGVPEPFLSPRFGAAPDSAPHAALLATFADAPPTATPGARHAYSNGNYAALAAVVERASGERYEDYLRRHVWGPAGMRRVAHPAWSDAPGLATAYARFSDRDPLGLEPRTPAPATEPARRGVLRGFGGGAYTAEDLFRFARALRTGRLLGPALTDTVIAGRVDTGNGPPGAVQYGFGFYEQQRGGGVRVVGHAGSNPNTGWDADVELVWDRDWTVVVLSNYDAPAALALSGPIMRLIAGQAAPAARAGAAPGTRPAPPEPVRAASGAPVQRSR